MPKYLIQGSYTSDGLKGLIKDKAYGRKSAVQAAMKSLKGKLESMYFVLVSIARFNPTAFQAVSFQQPVPIFDNGGNGGLQA